MFSLLEFLDSHKMTSNTMKSENFQYAIIIREELGDLFSKGITVLTYSYKAPKRMEECEDYNIVSFTTTVKDNSIEFRQCVDNEEMEHNLEFSCELNGLKVKFFTSEYYERFCEGTVERMTEIMKKDWKSYKTDEEIVSFLTECYTSSQPLCPLDIEFIRT